MFPQRLHQQYDQQRCLHFPHIISLCCCTVCIFPQYTSIDPLRPSTVWRDDSASSLVQNPLFSTCIEEGSDSLAATISGPLLEPPLPTVEPQTTDSEYDVLGDTSLPLQVHDGYESVGIRTTPATNEYEEVGALSI
eukprot:m.249745 g.249745  ORF g.249745 m.249745 type:complete len:136 (+) comp33878_c0_seq4:3839-4246(+)